MMTRWVRALRPDANEPLLLAARAHHIRRWERPRDSFPAGREGYLRWRAMLQRFHADALGEIMADVGYAAAEVKRAQDLVRKRGLGRDPDAQAMEDALCLVFIETQLADFAGHPRRRRPHGRGARKHLAKDEPRRPRRSPNPRPRRPRPPSPATRRRPSRGDRTGVQADPPEAHVTDASPAARRSTAAKLYRLLIILTPLVILLQGFLFGGFYSGGGGTMLDIHLWLGRISFAVVLARHPPRRAPRRLRPRHPHRPRHRGPRRPLDRPAIPRRRLRRLPLVLRPPRPPRHRHVRLFPRAYRHGLAVQALGTLLPSSTAPHHRRGTFEGTKASSSTALIPVASAHVQDWPANQFGAPCTMWDRRSVTRLHGHLSPCCGSV